MNQASDPARSGQRRPARRRSRRRRTPPGAPPGTLIADPHAVRPQMKLVSYGPGGLEEQLLETPDDLPASPPGDAVRWLDVAGVGDIEAVRQVGEAFGLHPLALEDIVNVHQRPKVEAYDDHLFIVARMPVAPRPEDVASRLETEQGAMCLGRDFLITFQERAGDVFDPVRRRLATEGSQIRLRGPDYLAYALIDAAVDGFFPILESCGEQVDDLETAVLGHPDFAHMSGIHDLKRSLLTARRAIWPQREMINSLIRDESPFVGAQTRIYLRDCYDHATQLIDMIETYREIASGLVDLQLSSVSNRMNEIMKVLTIIATIFIPLTFIVGIYGMNFDPDASSWNMPELGWRYGYPATLLFMVVVAAGLVLWFRRKGWIGKDRGS
jgi:magnesium transporter